MKLITLYHVKSESARKVEEFVHEFEKRTGQQIELMDLETKQGAEQAKLYDIVRYPAILAVRDDGELLKNWEGDELPLIGEVAAYTTM